MKTWLAICSIAFGIIYLYQEFVIDKDIEYTTKVEAWGVGICAIYLGIHLLSGC